MPACPTTTRRSSPRCGTWSGRAWSPTTRWRRCVRSAPRHGRARRRSVERVDGDPGPHGSHAWVRRRRRGAGRSSRRCSSRCPPPPSPRRPGPGSCWSGTACSPARRPSARGPRAGSPACTPCSRRWRTGATCGAATSWQGWEPHSSPCRERSTACERCATRPRTAARSCASPPPTRPSPTARRCRGPSLLAGRPAPLGRSSCWRAACRSSTWSAAAGRSSPSMATTAPTGPPRWWH